MRIAVDLRVLELLCARLCHELVSPVGAINNGVELLGEEDADFVKDAVALIGESARRAGKRLQFYRFAYGSSTGGSTAGPDPRELVAGVLEGGKVKCEWPAEARTLPLDWQKLACNLVIVASEVLPRGGTVTIRPLTAGASGIDVAAAGQTLTVSPELRAALSAAVAVDDLTSRTAQAYFTARIAEQIGAKLSIAAPAAGQVVFSAVAG